MKLLELFEKTIFESDDVDMKAYGWWLDDRGIFHKVNFERHDEFLHDNKQRFNIELTNYYNIRSWAFNKGWIRIATDTSIPNKLWIGFIGKKEALKKNITKIIRLAKLYDEATIDIIKIKPVEGIHPETLVFSRVNEFGRFYIPQDLSKISRFLNGTVIKEQVTNNQYGAWIDTNNNKVWEVTDHKTFFNTNILPHTMHIPASSARDYTQAYNNNWVRVIWPGDTSVSQQLSISGGVHAIKKAWRLIKNYVDIRSLDLVSIDFRNDDGTRASNTFFLQRPGERERFYKKIGLTA